MADIALGLYYTAVTPHLYEDDEEDDAGDNDHDEEEKARPFATYDGYWKMISENTTELIDCGVRRRCARVWHGRA